MRNIFSIVLIALLGFGLLVNDASAKRFGGGRSFGSQRSAGMFSKPALAKKSTHFNQRKAPGMRNFFGGLLVGSLISSLFMGHGFGGALFSWLFVGFIIYAVIAFLRRRKEFEQR